ncbi:MAG: hypothetical protein UV04_C0002G0033 [Candidatus Gottesmanbacteria bacterium GW2011_GWA2_42_16]|nr:MAG: hypothetical protein UV04_C0002G0033 [Candidatus Gottesmanbacteria bacterium GW2011_GWA2_42_16]
MKFLFRIGSLLLHIVALVLVGISFWPVATWYFNHRPILGVDFYNTVTFVRFLKENLEILPRGYLYFWFAGSPIDTVQVLSWFYPMAFVAKFYPLIETVKFFALAGFGGLLFFLYLTAYRLSRNHLLSALITAMVAMSANMYGSLTWGGSLPYFLNQLYFPLMLWLMASYLASGNSRWYWAGVLVLGLAYLGHLANAGAFVFPAAAAPLFFGMRARRVKIGQRIGEVIVLFLGGYLLAYRVTQGFLSGLIVHFLEGKILNPYGLGATVGKIGISKEGISVSGDQTLITVERSHFAVLFSDTNKLLFWLIAVAVGALVLGFLLDRHKKRIFSILPWVILAGYSVVHVLANAYGFPILPQAWYRAFWHFPISLGVAIAASAGYLHSAFTSRSKFGGQIAFSIITLAAIGGLIMLQSGGVAQNTISLLEQKSSPASAQPEAINLVRNQAELDELKSKLIPTWLDITNKNYRLYTSDAQVNVWWNALFDLPLVRGYLDPPVGTGFQGNHFLLDQAIAGDGLVTNFKYSESAARQMALYYIDWYGVRYAEGGHLSKSPNKGPSSYLTDLLVQTEDVEIPGAYLLYETKSGKPEVREDVGQFLKYYKFTDQIVSPILSGSNAPVVVCMCDWAAYESLTKILSLHNLNSRFLVTLFADKNIDDFTRDELRQFDGLILSNYRYKQKNRVFTLLTDYVEAGGKLFIDTGGETPEGQSNNIPELLPFRSTERRGLGKEWDLTPTAADIFSGIDLTALAPPVFSEAEWKFSYPTSDVKSDAKILLRQKGKPILISTKFGQGIVLWSGMNLAYHVQYYTNQVESQLYINLLKQMLSLSERPPVLGSAQFKNARQVNFSPEGTTRGILFKEEFFDNWQVKIDGRRVKAYAAGPSFPGFIYVPSTQAGQVSFTYNGNSRDYMIWFMSSLMIIILLDLSFFHGVLIGVHISHLAQKSQKWMGKWWEKEEE